MDLTTFSTSRLDNERAAELTRRVEVARLRAERLTDSPAQHPTGGAVVTRRRFALPMLPLHAAHR